MARALALRESEGKPFEIARVRQSMASVYGGMGDLEKALGEYERVLEVYRAHGAPAQSIYTVLHNIAGHRLKRGEPEAAVTLLRESLAMAEASADRRAVAYFLRTLAMSEGLLGRHHEALAAIERAVALFNEIGDPNGEARALTTLAERLGTLGQWREALAPLERALAVLRAQGDRSFQVNVLLARGLAHEALRRPAEARATLEEARDLARVTLQSELEGKALVELGPLYAAAGDRARARQALERAIELHGSDHNYAPLARAQANLAQLEVAEGRAAEAQEQWASALESSRRAGARGQEAEILYRLARAESAAGRLASACDRAREAVEIVESLRGAVPDLDLRISYLANQQDLYELYVDVLLQSHAREPGAGHAALAFEVSERARARGLLDTLLQAGVDTRRGVTPALAAEEMALRERLNAREYHRMGLLRKGAPPEEIAAAQEDIELLVASLQEVRRRLSLANPRYATLHQAQPVSVADTQRLVLDEDTALLEYALGTERSYLWIVTRSRFDVFPLASRAVIETAAQKLRRLLTARGDRPPFETQGRRRMRIEEADAQYAEAAAELSRLILEPAAARLGVRRLLIVPEGALQYVPFAALPTPGHAAGEPLVADREIASAPSASVLAALGRDRATGLLPLDLFVVADPVFEPDDPRVKPGSPQTSDASATASDARRAAESFGLGKIPRLPHSRREAEAILALVPQGRRRGALGFEARRSTLEDDVRRCRILHFATHAFVDDARPELSGLVLSLVDEGGRPDDGFLRLHDVYDLEVDADLVVLNACQTAVGTDTRGEGMIGLARGFFHAGAQRVLATLWNTSDKAAASVVTDFYRAHLRTGRSPSAALREAQLAMRARQPHPYYWAALVLQGR